MCELIVRVVDKINDDPYLNVQCLKRGDVVCICPDGWQWSEEEQKNPDWRIVKLPKLSELDASVFLGPEIDKDPQNPSKMLQRRAFKLDVDAFAPDLKAVIDDSKRDIAAVVLDVELPDVLALKVAKPVLSDPNVIALDEPLVP